MRASIEPMNRPTSSLARMRALFDANRKTYAALLHGFHAKLKELLAKEGLHPLITYRVKEFDSYVSKLAYMRRAQGQGPVLVRDLLGLRIVCPFLDESEQVQELLQRHFSIAEVEHKGMERSLAEFGYESVHLLVRLPKGTPVKLPPHTRRFFEVQVRTILQDAWAQIEHELVYKADPSVPKSAIRRKLAAVSGTLTLADLIFQEIRDDQSELNEQGVRRRESAQRIALGEENKPLATPRREISRLARRDRALRDPQSRNLEGLILDALRAHGAGELERAIGLYDHILRLRLPSPDIRSMIYNHRGIAHLALSRSGRAIREFSVALRWNPENARARYNRGLAYRVQEKLELALGDFRRAAVAHEVAASAHLAMAQILAETGRLREARAECERALAVDPDLQGARILWNDLRGNGTARRSAGGAS
jgi:putative GTP pyrophosphokinase